MTRSKSLVLALLALSLIALTTPRTASAAFVDPTGDTFGTGSVQLDITTVDAYVSGSSTVFTVTFLNSISAPSASAANSVTGFIDIDTDRNAATGATPQINLFGGAPAVLMGDEFYVDISSELLHAGTVDVFNATTNAIAYTVPITFTANSYQLSIPIVGTGAGQTLNYAVLAGTFTEATDRAPNGSIPITSDPIPEPGSLALLGAGALGVLGLGWRRRRIASRRTPRTPS